MNSANFAQQFEDLRIWQEARVQAVTVYGLFGNGSVAERDFGFRDQIQRAAVSVMNNIAEGVERRMAKDFAHFLDVAKASCGEVRSMIYLAEDLSYLDGKKSESLRGAASGFSRGIAALARTLRSRDV